MKQKIGFIGCGKMGNAMIAGMLQSMTVSREQIMASAATEATLQKIKERHGIHVTSSNAEVARFSDLLFLAVKPDQQTAVMEEIRHDLFSHTIVVTIAAGISLKDMEEGLGEGVKAVRSMPNTPSLVGEGMSAICANGHVSADELGLVVQLFESFGKAEVLEERWMDAVPSLSGSSPAFVYMFIEALADGGVLQGIPRDKAYRLAAQAVQGAAAMILETGKHPGELKDQVCTPGGATIEGVTALERHGFRSSILSAMESCTQKVRSLSLKK